MEKALELLSQMESFDPTIAMKYANENWQIPLTLTATYLAFCFFGSSMIAKPFNLKFPLALWNLLLSVFSFAGFIFTFPALLMSIQSLGFKNSICLDPKQGWAKGTTGLWVCLFIYSKVPELVDTVFIVLRKKPLIFLHWYHHATVLLYCWHSYANNVGIGLYFVAMNYGVHAVMYFYYFMQAVGICPKNFPAYLITAGQILQMVKKESIIVKSMERNLLQDEKEDSCYFSDDEGQCDLVIRRPTFKLWDESSAEPERRPSLESAGIVSLARIPERRNPVKDLSGKLTDLFGRDIDENMELETFASYAKSGVQISKRNGQYTELTLKRW
ncbi:hypothetical protein HDV01_001694 [Terramyces sp. JEL0728]|nr:hypothetical protein HDV01_001694 [Terramyces sp. JEL0728]